MYKRYDSVGLKSLVAESLERLGASKEDAETVADVLITADLWGIHTHGVERLPIYERRILNGCIQPAARIKVLNDSGFFTLIDAEGSLGHAVGVHSMNIAIQKAKTCGIGIVSVRNSTHYGIAGYYSMMAVKSNLMGVSLTNTGSIVVPTGGKQALLGTNPLSIALPAEPFPFLLDMATSVASSGKLLLCEKENRSIPPGWVIDKDGNSITDPTQARSTYMEHTGGGILPLGGLSDLFGGHKGYGLSAAIDILTAVLSGGDTSNNVASKDPNMERVCHLFCALDYGLLRDKKDIESQLNDYLQSLRNCDAINNDSPVLIHGEKEFHKEKENLAQGVPLREGIVETLKKMSIRLGLDPETFLIETGEK